MTGLKFKNLKEDDKNNTINSLDTARMEKNGKRGKEEKRKG